MAQIFCLAPLIIADMLPVVSRTKTTSTLGLAGGASTCTGAATGGGGGAATGGGGGGATATMGGGGIGFFEAVIFGAAIAAATMARVLRCFSMKRGNARPFDSI